VQLEARGRAWRFNRIAVRGILGAGLGTSPGVRREQNECTGCRLNAD
jgi:hypothetical protein